MNNIMDREMKQAELRKVDAEIAKLIAESARINQEAAKISQESRWYPVLIVTGLFTAIGGILMIFSKFL